MKKAKLMLLSIAVIAIVGGALAFRVEKTGSSRYCYVTTDTQPAIGSCEFWVTNRQARPLLSGENHIFYTTTQNVNACSQAECPNIGIPNADL